LKFIFFYQKIFILSSSGYENSLEISHKKSFFLISFFLIFPKNANFCITFFTIFSVKEEEEKIYNFFCIEKIRKPFSALQLHLALAENAIGN